MIQSPNKTSQLFNHKFSLGKVPEVNIDPIVDSASVIKQMPLLNKNGSTI